MTIDDTTKLLDAVTKLLGAILWPVLIGAIAIRFRPALKLFFDNLGELSLKGGGFEAIAKRQKADAADALALAVAARPEPGAAGRDVAQSAHGAKTLVSKMVTPPLLAKAARALVLWVDDRPDNNILERQSMESLGIRFVLATSTEQARELARCQNFDVIVSDMARASDARAGYTLLDSLRQAGDTTPFIIYASSSTPEHKLEARQHGALDSTGRPSELFEDVLSALRRTG